MNPGIDTMRDGAEAVGLRMPERTPAPRYDGNYPGGRDRGHLTKQQMVSAAPPTSPTTVGTAENNLMLLRECNDLAQSILRRISPRPEAAEENQKPNGLMDILILSNQDILRLRDTLRQIEQTV